jgi:hypothetical protein
MAAPAAAHPEGVTFVGRSENPANFGTTFLMAKHTADESVAMIDHRLRMQ